MSEHRPDGNNAAATLLAQGARAAGGSAAACRDAGTVLSYDGLARAASGIACELAGLHGIVPGDRVLLAAPNGCALMAAMLGTMLAGAVAVPAMPLLKAGEIAHMLGRARPLLALCAGPVAAECREAIRRSGIAIPVVALDGLLARVPAASGFEPPDTAADDPALLLFTSGTTGRPKAILHRHRDILAIERSFGRHVFRTRPGDVVGGSPSLAFAYGFGVLLAFPLGAGAAVHLSAGGKPRELARLPDLTMLATAPTGWRKLLAEPEIAALPGLRRCFSAGEPLPAAVAEAWAERSGLGIVDMLGSTEMLGPYVATRDDDPPGAPGRAVPGYELKILDRRGRALPAGTSGRLAVRGPSGGSFLDPAEEARHRRDGWLITGDRACIDAEGRVHFEGRADDILVCAGYNISAPEVEAVLARHEAVEDCALVAVPDGNGARMPVALVVPRKSGEGGADLAARLLGHLRAELAIFKLPREICFVPDLPRTASGKLRRKALAARLAREHP